MPPLAQMQRQR